MAAVTSLTLPIRTCSPTACTTACTGRKVDYVHSRRRSRAEGNVDNLNFHATSLDRRLIASGAVLASGMHAAQQFSSTSINTQLTALDDRHNSGNTAGGAGVQDSEGASTTGDLLQEELPIGRLTIGRMRPDETRAVSVLVTRAFAGTPEAQSFSDVREYVETLSEDPAESLVLVARLEPADRSLLPEGRVSRLVGVAMLSFVPETRDQFPTLQPPPEAAYLSNTAVDEKFRRQGVARLLLRVSENACRAAGLMDITLHARLVDEAALQLYGGAGFTELGRDSIAWTPWRRFRPRVLMAKRL